MAERLYMDLRKADINVWLDSRSLLSGEDWERTIRKTIKEADAVDRTPVLIRVAPVQIKPRLEQFGGEVQDGHPYQVAQILDDLNSGVQARRFG